jgi:plasmid stabilization system protein ParE
LKPVRLLADAEVEVDAALGWYRRELPHRAQAFANAIADVLDAIGNEPEAYPPVSDAPLPMHGREIRRRRGDRRHCSRACESGTRILEPPPRRSLKYAAHQRSRGRLTSKTI